MKLETERCLIRPFTERDADDAFYYLSDPETMYFIQDPFTREDTEGFIRRYGMERKLVYALEHKESGRVIGHVIFHPYEDKEIYEIGCIIGKPYRQQRIGYEALSEVIRFAFTEMKLHKIVAETVEGNDACIHLMDRLGFVREAVLRKQNRVHGHWADEYHYGMLREEYRENC